jgi:hypothetical protein
MGLDARLVDEANMVPHDKIYFLTRDQIAEFGIDRSEFQETPWTLTDSASSKPAISKVFLERKGAERKEFPTRYVRLSCVGDGRVSIIYSRGLASGENTNLQINLTLASGSIPVSATSLHAYDWLENKRLFDVRIGEASFSLLEASSADAPEIIETSWTAPAPYTHIIKLSSLGWNEAVGKLREKCANR